MEAAAAALSGSPVVVKHGGLFLFLTNGKRTNNVARQLWEATMAWFKDAVAGFGLIVFFASSLYLAGAAQAWLAAA